MWADGIAAVHGSPSGRPVLGLPAPIDLVALIRPTAMHLPEGGSPLHNLPPAAAMPARGVRAAAALSWLRAARPAMTTEALLLVVAIMTVLQARRVIASA